MSKQTINIGASPNDGTGTPLRTSFDYTNQNFTELYTALGGGVGLPGATTQVIFNDGGTNLAGDAGLVYNKTTDALTVAGLVTAGSASITGDLTVDTSTLKVDSTNNRVGIGTATPSQALHVIDNILTVSAVGTDSHVNVATAGVQNSFFGFNNSGSTNASGASNNHQYISNGNGYPIQIATNGVSIATFSTAAVTLTAQNLVMATSGKGIDFAATSEGSGTMTSELLNDYEEGTFTPTVIGGTIAGVGVYGVQVGRYTKVGNLVNVQVYLDWSAHTGTGEMSFGNFPFTTNSTAGTYSSAAIGYSNNIALTASNILTAWANVSATSIRAYQTPVGGGAATAVPIDTSGEIMFSITYRV